MPIIALWIASAALDLPIWMPVVGTFALILHAEYRRRTPYKH